jgi:hypothetical protein
VLPSAMSSEAKLRTFASLTYQAGVSAKTNLSRSLRTGNLAPPMRSLIERACRWMGWARIRLAMSV